MTVAAGEILTAETIPKYLEERWESEQLAKAFTNTNSNSNSNAEEAFKDIKVATIEGGNVNYAFCIELPALHKKIFLKQAPEFVAIFGPDGFPLTSERMQREMDAYSEWKTILGDELAKKYLPDIYYFDKKNMVVVMEFFDGYELLDHVLVDKEGASKLLDNNNNNDNNNNDNDNDNDSSNNNNNNNNTVGSSLGDFMGRVHAATHSSKISVERIAYLTEHFENREMRDVQLEFVFTKCYKEATDEQRAGLTLTDEFMEQVELLKHQYNGKVGVDHSSLVLTHGDLHPGSVMVDVNSNSTKVIDPEFTVYGPAGLDVGSLLSGYCLGAIHQAFSCDNDNDNDNDSDVVAKIVAGAEAVWNSYAAALKHGGLTQAHITAIEIETVGFTVAEVCRTALEFAGGRKWLQFDDDPVAKARSKKAALTIVNNCMIARHTGGIALLFSEMKAVSTSK